MTPKKQHLCSKGLNDFQLMLSYIVILLWICLHFKASFVTMAYDYMLGRNDLTVITAKNIDTQKAKQMSKPTLLNPYEPLELSSLKRNVWLKNDPVMKKPFPYAFFCL